MSEAADLAVRKERLRGEAKVRRALPSPRQRAAWDGAIAQRLCSLEAFGEASLLLTYVSAGTEADTSAIIETAWKLGKRVAVPRCSEDRPEMDFYFICSRKDLLPGAWGSLEPDPRSCKKLTDFGAGLCLVPALLCDEQGWRLGFGGGYYDRFLARFGGTSVILAYELSVSDTPLPCGRYDRRADYIVTEKRVLQTDERRFCGDERAKGPRR